jgi:hypothetical protein
LHNLCQCTFVFVPCRGDRGREVLRGEESATGGEGANILPGPMDVDSTIHATWRPLQLYFFMELGMLARSDKQLNISNSDLERNELQSWTSPTIRA